jgi:hypothetical protein
MENYSQVCVWPGVIVGQNDKKAFELWLLEQFNVRGIYCEEVVTLPSKNEEGGRNDVFFRVHTDDIMNFAVQRLGYGIRWWEDVLGNGGAKLYPSNILETYPQTW